MSHSMNEEGNMSGPSCSNENGFTLIELLFVMATIGVLATLSIVSFGVYKEQAYFGVSKSTLRNSKTALEAGRIDQVVTTPVFWSQSASGQITDSTARLVVPGLTLPDNLRFTLNTNPACTAGPCVAESLYVKHIKTNE